jgi:hypothetical protein
MKTESPKFREPGGEVKIPSLLFSDLARGTVGIPPAFGECLSQAASICLEDQKHESGVHLGVDGDFNHAFCLIWEDTTDQMRRCWADAQVTTEHGAYGIAALLMPNLTGLTFIERSIKGTGFDFWLGQESNLLFQKKARLEVSGIRKGNESEIKARIKQKKEQTKRSDNTYRLPAYIIVVEFGEPQSRVVRR